MPLIRPISFKGKNIASASSDDCGTFETDNRCSPRNVLKSHGGHEMTYDPNLQQRPMESDPNNPRSTIAKSGGGTGFLVAGIIIAALVIGGYFFFNRSDVGMSPTAPTPPAATETTPAPATPEPPAATAPQPTAPAPAEPAPAPATPAPAPAPAQ